MSSEEFADLNNKLQTAGYPEAKNEIEIKSHVQHFLSDYNLGYEIQKEELWLELLNHGFNLGDRILNYSTPMLKGSDIEELQEFLSRLGFYSDPITSEFDKNVVKAVESFQENRGLSIDGVVGLSTAMEIKKLIRPTLHTSLNEAIKGFKPNKSKIKMSFYVDNVGEYSEQIIFYESLKEEALKMGLKLNFVSEVGQNISIENVVNFINKTNPTIFITLSNNDASSVSYFQGKYSFSNIGKSIAENLSKDLNLKTEGKNNVLLKNTKSIAIIINGNFYQFDTKIIISSIFNTFDSIYKD